MSETEGRSEEMKMEMQKKIEEYNDLALRTKLEIMHDIIRDLKAVETDSLDDTALEEHTQALHQAHRLYRLLNKEYVKRLKGEVDVLLEALGEKEQEEREHGEEDRDE